MAIPIENLSDHQAIQALRLFYDLSPDHLWEGGRKPPPERIRTLASDLQSEAPAEYARFLSLLLDDSPANAYSRATLCRLLLTSLHDSPALQACADQAVETAAQLDMAIDPVTGMFLVFLALAVIPRIEKGPHGLKVIPAAGLESMLKALPPVLSAVPKEILSALAAKIGG